jgi:hypothetical protein
MFDSWEVKVLVAERTRPRAQWDGRMGESFLGSASLAREEAEAPNRAEDPDRDALHSIYALTNISLEPIFLSYA